MRFRLIPRSMTLDDLELPQVRIFVEFRGISQIWEATTAKRMEITTDVFRAIDLTQISLLGAFIHALLSRAHLAFKSTNNTWRYERKCEWVFFSEHVQSAVRHYVRSAILQAIARAWLLVHFHLLLQPPFPPRSVFFVHNHLRCPVGKGRDHMPASTEALVDFMGVCRGSIEVGRLPGHMQGGEAPKADILVPK